jgi:hypothetical protein
MEFENNYRENLINKNIDEKENLGGIESEIELMDKKKGEVLEEMEEIMELSGEVEEKKYEKEEKSEDEIEDLNELLTAFQAGDINMEELEDEEKIIVDELKKDDKKSK